MKNILLAGVSGHLGAYILRELSRNHYNVHGLTRDPRRVDAGRDMIARIHEGDLTAPASLNGICRGIDAVISCAGASLDVRQLRDRQRFMDVDYRGNLNLLREAQAAGVGKFVYVSVFNARAHRHLEYCDAHERFADALAESGMAHAIIYPTGFFSVFTEIWTMARGGLAIQIGDGSHRTNPIFDGDLAHLCVAALTGVDTHIAAGGPQVITRRQTAELAFRALERTPRIISVPPFFFRMAAAAIRPFNRRIAALLRFGIEVSLTDTIAPAHGSHLLLDYYRQLQQREKAPANGDTLPAPASRKSASTGNESGPS